MSYGRQMTTNPSQIDPIPVIWMAGQSNMDGMGWNRDLAQRIREPVPDCWIYNPNRRKDGEPPDTLTRWHPLTPGFGYGLSHNQRGVDLSDRFGVELPFAHRFRELRPDSPLALLKVAKGGSSLHPDPPSDWGTWDPETDRRGGRNQFTYLREAVGACRNLPPPVPTATIADKPSLFIWIQGESDAAFSNSIASAYEENLSRFLEKVRIVADHPALPVLLVQLARGAILPNGKPSMPWAETIRIAQERVADNDTGIKLISIPDPVGWQDPWHYDSDTLLKLGNRLADESMEFLDMNRNST